MDELSYRVTLYSFSWIDCSIHEDFPVSHNNTFDDHGTHYVLDMTLENQNWVLAQFISRMQTSKYQSVVLVIDTPSPIQIRYHSGRISRPSSSSSDVRSTRIDFGTMSDQDRNLVILEQKSIQLNEELHVIHVRLEYQIHKTSSLMYYIWPEFRPTSVASRSSLVQNLNRPSSGKSKSKSAAVSRRYDSPIDNCAQRRKEECLLGWTCHRMEKKLARKWISYADASKEHKVELLEEQSARLELHKSMDDQYHHMQASEIQRSLMLSECILVFRRMHLLQEDIQDSMENQIEIHVESIEQRLEQIKDDIQLYIMHTSEQMQKKPQLVLSQEQAFSQQEEAEQAAMGWDQMWVQIQNLRQTFEPLGEDGFSPNVTRLWMQSKDTCMHSIQSRFWRQQRDVSQTYAKKWHAWKHTTELEFQEFQQSLQLQYFTGQKNALERQLKQYRHELENFVDYHRRYIQSVHSGLHAHMIHQFHDMTPVSKISSSSSDGCFCLRLIYNDTNVRIKNLVHGLLLQLRHGRKETGDDSVFWSSATASKHVLLWTVEEQELFYSSNTQVLDSSDTSLDEATNAWIDGYVIISDNSCYASPTFHLNVQSAVASDKVCLHLQLDSICDNAQQYVHVMKKQGDTQEDRPQSFKDWNAQMKRVQQDLPMAVNVHDEELPLSLEAFECPFCSFWTDDEHQDEHKQKQKQNVPYSCLSCMVSNDLLLHPYLLPLSRAINEMYDQHKTIAAVCSSTLSHKTSRWTTRAKKSAQERMEKYEKVQHQLFEQRRDALNRFFQTTRLRYYQDFVALFQAQMNCQRQFFEYNQSGIVGQHEFVTEQHSVSNYSISRSKEHLELCWMENEDWNAATLAKSCHSWTDAITLIESALESANEYHDQNEVRARYLMLGQQIRTHHSIYEQYLMAIEDIQTHIQIQFQQTKEEIDQDAVRFLQLLHCRSENDIESCEPARPLLFFGSYAQHQLNDSFQDLVQAEQLFKSCVDESWFSELKVRQLISEIQKLQSQKQDFYRMYRPAPKYTPMTEPEDDMDNPALIPAHDLVKQWNQLQSVTDFAHTQVALEVNQFEAANDMLIFAQRYVLAFRQYWQGKRQAILRHHQEAYAQVKDESQKLELEYQYIRDELLDTRAQVNGLLEKVLLQKTQYDCYLRFHQYYREYAMVLRHGQPSGVSPSSSGRSIQWTGQLLHTLLHHTEQLDQDQEQILGLTQQLEDELEVLEPHYRVQQCRLDRALFEWLKSIELQRQLVQSLNGLNQWLQTKENLRRVIFRTPTQSSSSTEKEQRGEAFVPLSSFISSLDSSPEKKETSGTLSKATLDRTRTSLEHMEIQQKETSVEIKLSYLVHVQEMERRRQCLYRDFAERYCCDFVQLWNVQLERDANLASFVAMDTFAKSFRSLEEKQNEVFWQVSRRHYGTSSHNYVYG